MKFQRMQMSIENFSFTDIPSVTSYLVKRLVVFILSDNYLTFLFTYIAAMKKKIPLKETMSAIYEEKHIIIMHVHTLFKFNLHFL